MAPNGPLSYRPIGKGGSWFPGAPLAVGGSVQWNDGLLLDWSTGMVGPRPSASIWKAYVKGARDKGLTSPSLYARYPGMRNAEALKSTATHKIFVGGPWHGAKLRAYVKLNRAPKITVGGKTKRAGNVIELVPVLESVVTVKPFRGRYTLDQETDKYRWS